MDNSGSNSGKIDYTERIFGKTVKRVREAKNASAEAVNESIRASANNFSSKKYQSEVDELKKELDNLKMENRKIKTVSELEKAGCLNPSLVLKAVPDDCENLQDWIENFKVENDYLFKQSGSSHGNAFKPSQTKNLTASEVMNNFIRGLY